jgi:hypothetical protein
MFRNALIIIAVVLAFVSTSCKKTEPCNAVISVLDTLDRPVVGARVVLRQDSVINPTTGVRADILEEGVTAANGEAYFEFKLEAVLNVEVTYDIRSAKDYIRLEQSETVRKTIILK